MSSSNKEVRAAITSDELHNRNCFNYLNKLKIPKFVMEQFPEVMAQQLRVAGNAGAKYNPEVAYGNLYTQFFEHIEPKIAALYDETSYEARVAEASIQNATELLPRTTKIEEQTIKLGIASSEQKLKNFKNLNEFVISIYDNDNQILEDTFNEIKHITLEQNPVSSSIEGQISKHTKDKGTAINSETPSQAGSAYGRFSAMMSDNFKPQHTTSLATVRHYGFNQNSPMREYRFGTQGQRHEGIERVSPLFEAFLKAKSHLNNPNGGDEPISHIYFNNLGRDRTDSEGKKEQKLTNVLHDLEKNHPNIAVITLPADKGFLQHNAYGKTAPKLDVGQVKSDFLAIASQDPNSTLKFKNDFFISDKVRHQLFKDENGSYSKEAESAKLNELIDKSFTALDIPNQGKISESQRQAVWFHFIKFEVTNHIIETLQPKGVNFTCKDAIDRGGVSSAYYNLIKSFEPNATAMNREEFERGLHAAPTMVKARGMNHHLHVIWNSVDAYVNANHEALKNDQDKSWLIQWRDANCPHARVESLLAQRIEESTNDLVAAKNDPMNSERLKVIDDSIEIINQIKSQSDMGVSGKRLLLEATVRTTELALKNPSPKEAKRYEELADKIEVKYPKLQFIGGMMKALAGYLLYIPTRGKSEGLIDSGLSTAKASLESSTRKDIQEKMKSQLAAMKHEAEEPEKENNLSKSNMNKM